MIRESPIGENLTHLQSSNQNTLHQANAHDEGHDNDTPIIKPIQNSLQDQLPLQQKSRLQSGIAPGIFRNNKEIGPQSYQPQRERKSTFSRQVQEQIQSAVAVVTKRGDEEESDDSNKKHQYNTDANNQSQEKRSFSLRSWEYIKNALILLVNLLTNKEQEFQNKEMEQKYIQIKLESTFENFICIQWSLVFIYLALFIINICRGKFSDQDSSSSSSTPTSQSSNQASQQNDNISYQINNTLIEVILQLIIGILNLGLICISKSNRLIVRGFLIMIQLAELVYLEKLLFGDINDYFYGSLTNSNSTQQSYQQNYGDSWDLYVELRFELLKSIILMIGCFLFMRNMCGWNYRLFLSSILVLVFGIILYHENSFWLFITSIILLAILFSYYFYQEEKKSRSTYIELQSHQDKNSPSLYNMIHEQISSGLIVVTRNNENTTQGNELLQLKFANKISVEQLQCKDENDILQKFKEISVKSEMSPSIIDESSQGDSSSSDSEQRDSSNIHKKDKNSLLNLKKQNQANSLGQNQTLYDKLVYYMEEIYRLQQQNNDHHVVSVNSFKQQRQNTYHPSIINKLKTDYSKKTSSMIQLGKTESRKQIRQNSFTPINSNYKSKSQTPRHHSTMMKANFSSNINIGTNIKPISSEYSIKQKNSIFNPNPSDLHQKISGSKIENNTSDLKFRRKGSFINMNAVVSQFTPKNAAINGISPVRGKSTPSGEEVILDSQQRVSNLKLKAMFSQVSDTKGNIQSPITVKESQLRKLTLDRKPDKSSFGQLIYGVMKSSNYDSQPMKQSAFDTLNSAQKENENNKNQPHFNYSQYNKSKQKSDDQEDCNVKEDQIQSTQKKLLNNLHLGSNHQIDEESNKYNGKLKENYKTDRQDDKEESSDESNSQQMGGKDKNQFTSSMIQVQIPSTEVSFQQFDFKINLIEWDNSPALIILVTDSTEKLVNEKLKELEMYKEELLYTMQHISRTPLNSIINISDILLNEYFKQYKMTSSQRQILPINTPSTIQNNNNNNNMVANLYNNINGQLNNNFSNNNTNNTNTPKNFNTNTATNNNNINNLNNSPNYLKQGSSNSILNALANNNSNNNPNTPSILNNFPSLNQHYSSQSHPLGNGSEIQQNNNNFINISPLKGGSQNANNMAILQEKQLNELETVVQNLHIIKNNGLILLHTINTVTDLSFFQTNQGKLNIDPETFSLQNIIEEIYDLYLHQIQEKKLTFSFMIPQNVDRIYSDKKRVVQVLFEIIGNAIKYTSNGNIQVKIKEQEKGLIWIKVQDSGQGMSESQKHSLFSNKLIQYYSRERDFSKKNSAGLGLDFSRKIVGLLGPFYQIFIKSSEGVGSTFKFLLYSDYKYRDHVDIPTLRQRIMMLQNQNNDQGGGIFTPDIINNKNNKSEKTTYNQQTHQTNNSNGQQNPQSSHQILIKKGSDSQQQQIFHQTLKKNANQKLNQIYSTSNSKIYNSGGLNNFNGAVSDVAEADELVGSKQVGQIPFQLNGKRESELGGNYNFNDDKSNNSYLKYSHPKMEKYQSLDYQIDRKYRLPLSAQNNQIYIQDTDPGISTGLGGNYQKKKKKLPYKNQVFTPQHLQQRQGPLPGFERQNKVQQSEQRIPCIEINEDVEQWYNRGDFEQDQYIKQGNLKENLNSDESQNKSHKIDQNNYSTRNIDDNNDSPVQNQYYNNINLDNPNQIRQSFASPLKGNKNQNNSEHDNILQIHINSFSQTMQNGANNQSQKLNNSQHLSDDSQLTVGGGNNCLHQSQSIDQSGIIPKRVYNSSSTNPNNLKHLGPSIFMKTSPFNINQCNSFYLSIPATVSNKLNVNNLSHQRIEMNQVINKSNITDDIENQDPPPEQSFIDNVSPEMQIKQESIYIEQNTPRQKNGIKGQISQLQQQQQYQPNSPIKRIKLERKETRNPSVICQTLKIDDYDYMLYQAFPEKSYVLGVDDNVFNLNILEMVFKKCSNIIFHKAGNGKEAIEKVLQLKQSQNVYYKIFLMDIQMPVMDGYKAHSELKKLMKKKIIQKSPVFAVTAFANEKQICISQGMEGFIEKPINMKLLINLIYDYFIQNNNLHSYIKQEHQ